MPTLAAKSMATVLPVFIAGLFPALTVVAPKATVIVLVAAGLSGLGLAFARGVWRDLFPPVPVSLTALAMGWMLFKSLSNFDRHLSVELWLRLAALMLCGFGALWLFRTLPPNLKRRVHDALIAGCIVGLALFFIFLAGIRLGVAGFPGADRQDPLAAFSPGLMIIAMVSPLVWGVLLERRRWIVALVLLVATLAATWQSSSNIAFLAVIIAVPWMVWGGQFWAGRSWGKGLQRSGLNVLAAILAIFILAAPVVFSTLPAKFVDAPILASTARLAGAAGELARSVQHRFQIWMFVAERAKQRPYLGWGLDASRRIPGGNVPTSLGEAVLPLHPHNAILQIWLELGVPGLVILALLVGALMAAPAGRHAPELSSPLSPAVRAATILSTSLIACLAFGIWQNWWVSSLWLTAALVSTFPGRERERERPSGRAVRMLINGLHSKSGGGLTYLRNMVPLLARDTGLEVHLCLHDDQRESLSEIFDGVTVHFFSFRQGFWRLLVREQVAVPALADRIAADVTFSPANYGPVFAPNPVIMLRNAPAVGLVERRPGKIAYWALLSLASAASLLGARAAIAVSDYARRSLAGGLVRPLRRRVVVIPHGVAELFSPPAEQHGREGFLLAVSDIYVQKNFANLLRAFARISAGHPDVRLMIAGRPVDTALYRTLQAFVADHGLDRRVQFLGTVAPKELAELYRRCAVFVFPSMVETFGNPLVEAMASGAAIASSKTTAMPEILGQAGVYFDPRDSDDMAATLDRLLNDPDLRAELGKRAVVRARDFSWQRTADRTAAVIKRVAGSG